MHNFLYLNFVWMNLPVSDNSKYGTGLLFSNSLECSRRSTTIEQQIWESLKVNLLHARLPNVLTKSMLPVWRRHYSACLLNQFFCSLPPPWSEKTECFPDKSEFYKDASWCTLHCTTWSVSLRVSSSRECSEVRLLPAASRWDCRQLWRWPSSCGWSRSLQPSGEDRLGSRLKWNNNLGRGGTRGLGESDWKIWKYKMD